MKIYVAYFKDFGLSVYPFKTGFDLVLICVTFSVEFKNNADKSKTEDQEA